MSNNVQVLEFFMYVHSSNGSFRVLIKKNPDISRDNTLKSIMYFKNKFTDKLVMVVYFNDSSRIKASNIQLKRKYKIL